MISTFDFSELYNVNWIVLWVDKVKLKSKWVRREQENVPQTMGMKLRITAYWLIEQINVRSNGKKESKIWLRPTSGNRCQES